MKYLLLPCMGLLAGLLACSSADSASEVHLIDASDIERFWFAYDTITQVTDSAMQAALLDQYYLQPGSPGLHGIIAAKRYEPAEFLAVIRQYPKFWASVRPNTLRAQDFTRELQQGIEQLRDLYPKLTPARIYFTVGAMRSGGTTLDSMVLIGSELAMVDSSTDYSEFEGRMYDWAETYFGGNPIEHLVLLNIHEYVHTQQSPIPQELLYQCLYEGVAEFISTKAMNLPSAAPAIEYGYTHPAVRDSFERQMFHQRTYEWLWSNAPNAFGVRDLGYYIGYAICEQYYQLAPDKAAAIREMITLDYSNPAQVDAFIDQAGYFDHPISRLREEFQARRPQVMALHPFSSGDTIAPGSYELAIEFTQPMGERSNFEYGPLGVSASLQIAEVLGWSEDRRTFSVRLAPMEAGRRYQLLIGAGFANERGAPITPFLIEVNTQAE